MNRAIMVFALLCLAFGCTKRPKVEDITFKFCEQVSSSKREYHTCFVDLLECYEKTPDTFDDDDQVFLECARLLYNQSAPVDDKSQREKIAGEIIKGWEEELDRDTDLVKPRKKY